MSTPIEKVVDKLAWMRDQGIWPNGLRYLWTDAFGVILLVSLYRELGVRRWLEEAEEVVADVERVLGRPSGIRIGEAPDRDGQYFHYLGMWIFALDRIGRLIPEYRNKAVKLVREIHPYFVVPGLGVHWKMKEDLSRPYPGYGFGALDPYHGYVVYRLLAQEELAEEIAQMRAIVNADYQSLSIDQDLGLGMMLWMSHFFADEAWAVWQRRKSLETLRSMWIDPPGYYCRHPAMRGVKYAFTNYGISMGLQAAGGYSEAVEKLNVFFESYSSGDEYDREAITHIMACTSWFPGEFLKKNWRN